VKTSCWLGFVILLASVGSAAADPPAPLLPCWQRWWLGTANCPSVGCCPDDYCRKPLPCVPVVRCGGPDDYCRKPLPCVPVVRCGGPDDYCRKPLPCLLCPPWSPYLQCGPPDGSCPTCRQHR
jgi:hypothetical protein